MTEYRFKRQQTAEQRLQEIAQKRKKKRKALLKKLNKL